MTKPIPAKYAYGAMAALFAAGVGVGVGVSALVVKKRLDDEYEDRLKEEVEQTVEFVLSQIPKPRVTTPEVVTPEETFDEIDGERVFEEKPPLEDIRYHSQKVAYHKILSDENYAEEAAELEPKEEVYEDPDISVISKDIFLENGSGFDQTTLTYFADGGVLDIMGDYVVDHENKIGPGVPRFGEMSQDPNIVYVRNRRLEEEYEVISDPGNASQFANPQESEEIPEHLMHSLQDKYRPDHRR